VEMHSLEGEEDLQSLMSHAFLWLWKRRTYLKKSVIKNALQFTGGFTQVN
jgi:hypothetical protein